MLSSNVPLEMTPPVKFNLRLIGEMQISVKNEIWVPPREMKICCCAKADLKWEWNKGRSLETSYKLWNSPQNNAIRRKHLVNRGLGFCGPLPGDTNATIGRESQESKHTSGPEKEFHSRQNRSEDMGYPGKEGVWGHFTGKLAVVWALFDKKTCKYTRGETWFASGRV